MLRISIFVRISVSGGRRASNVRIIMFLVRESCNSDPEKRTSQTFECFWNVGQRGAVTAGSLPVPYRLRVAGMDHAPIIAATQTQSVGQCSAIRKFVTR